MCYKFLDDKTIEFSCNSEDFTDLEEFEEVYLAGSFNGWLNTGDSDWKFTTKDKKFFSLTKNLKDVMIPGNTGFPEYRFFGLSSSSCHLLHETKEILEKIEDEKFLENRIILQNDSEIEELKQLKMKYVKAKKLSEFDLDCPACRSEISNVRIVPGTNCLFRGYNPFKKSKANYDTEEDRIAIVQKAFEIYGIKSDITLNGYEGANSLEGEIVPDVIKQIERENNRLCINIDYNLVYFHSDANDFILSLKKIGRFIINHPGPYYIHCRLGSDRTGVICAILASLCGVSWEEIAIDYEKAHNMGIGEYRNRRLLQYSLNKMLGKNPAAVRDLKSVVRNFFHEENVFTSAEMDRIVEKLNEYPARKETDYFDFTGKHICLGGKKKSIHSAKKS